MDWSFFDKICLKLLELPFLQYVDYDQRKDRGELIFLAMEGKRGGNQQGLIFKILGLRGKHVFHLSGKP